MMVFIPEALVAVGIMQAFVSLRKRTTAAGRKEKSVKIRTVVGLSQPGESIEKAMLSQEWNLFCKKKSVRFDATDLSRVFCRNIKNRL
jgi:hypothetical protein